MKSFLRYGMGVCILLNALAVQAIEKFEVLPDLPDPLAYAVQPAEAASVSGNANIATLGAQTVGSEPSIISVVLSLLFVIFLIYFVSIAYAKLNKIGFKTLRHYQGECARSQVNVISTTQLGGNKTLHVVELDGKRMLIGASSSTIQLIKDLGTSNKTSEDENYSHIEIPNIKIPKIEIPKIEIPAINFSKLVTKTHKPMSEVVEQEDRVDNLPEDTSVQNDDSKSDNSNIIIDSLFAQQEEQIQGAEDLNPNAEHIVDPEDFSLYKKYLA